MVFSSDLEFLPQDFYLDLAEDGRRITPREYLESALQPMSGNGKAVAAKNEVNMEFLKKAVFQIAFKPATKETGSKTD
jgi:hypothetical protein